jgi:hypothetical protein
VDKLLGQFGYWFLFSVYWVLVFACVNHGDDGLFEAMVSQGLLGVLGPEWELGELFGLFGWQVCFSNRGYGLCG